MSNLHVEILILIYIIMITNRYYSDINEHKASAKKTAAKW